MVRCISSGAEVLYDFLSSSYLTYVKITQSNAVSILTEIRGIIKNNGIEQFFFISWHILEGNMALVSSVFLNSQCHLLNYIAISSSLCSEENGPLLL